MVPFGLPEAGIVSIAGFALVTGEILIGLAMGFAVQIGFSAALLAGETIGNAMGLGFSSMIDPQSGQASPALGQFLSILGTFLFLSIGGHLALAALVFESYVALPPGEAWLGAASLKGLVDFGGIVFSAGVAIALPVAFAIILVQVVMGMLSRSAPAMNLFSVGLAGGAAGRHHPARDRRPCDGRSDPDARSSAASKWPAISLAAVESAAGKHWLFSFVNHHGALRFLQLAEEQVSEDADKDQKTEAPTDKRKREAVEKGDVLQSRELGTALVVLAGRRVDGAGWPVDGRSAGGDASYPLTFNSSAVTDFDPGRAVPAMLGIVALPVVVLFGLTLLAAIGTPARRWDRWVSAGARWHSRATSSTRSMV